MQQHKQNVSDVSHDSKIKIPLIDIFEGAMPQAGISIERVAKVMSTLAQASKRHYDFFKSSLDEKVLNILLQAVTGVVN